MLLGRIQFPPQKPCTLNVIECRSLFSFPPSLVAHCPDHSEMKAICALQYRAGSGMSEAASGFCLTTPPAAAITALGERKGCWPQSDIYVRVDTGRPCDISLISHQNTAKCTFLPPCLNRAHLIVFNNLVWMYQVIITMYLKFTDILSHTTIM